MSDKLIKILSLFFFIWGCFTIEKEIRITGLSQLEQNIKETPLFLMFLGLLATLFNFFILSFYDRLGLSYLKKKLPFLKVFKISALSFAISNVAGHTYASGGAVRFLFLRSMGLNKKDIFVLISLISLYVFLGLVAGFMLTCFIKILLNVPINTLPLFLFESGAVASGLFFAFYFKKTVQKQKGFRVKKFFLKLPSAKHSLGGILTGLADFLSLFLVFYLFLSDKESFSFSMVFIAFSLSCLGAYLSQVPAGIGIFESLFLVLLPHTPPQKEAILTAFLLFRLFYYILPFVLAGFYLSMKNISSK